MLVAVCAADRNRDVSCDTANIIVVFARYVRE